MLREALANLFFQHQFIPGHNQDIGNVVDLSGVIEHAANVAQIRGLVSPEEVLPLQKGIEEGVYKFLA